MRYYIDLDNTLCRTIGNDYINSIPIHERIRYVNELKENGHEVTIWTARGQTTGTDYRELTLNQLNEWNVNYDNLLMGKPNYDVYIDDKSFNVDEHWPVPKNENELRGNEYKEKSKKLISEVVPKGWGKEIIFVNNDEYCGKILCFEKDKKFSMHYHVQKKETWYVSKGRFILIWIETNNGVVHTEYLNVGDVITNERGEPHQLIALENSEIFEVSTKHYDEDSFRIKKGN